LGLTSNTDSTLAWAAVDNILKVFPPRRTTGPIIQAVGTAVFVPLLITTTMRLVPASRRGRMMALVTAVPAVAPAVGPAVPGLVLSQLSWRWLFIVMLPIVVVTLILGTAKLRNVTVPERVTLDVVSLLLSVVGFGGMVFGLASIGESVSGHAPVPPYLPILVGLIGVSGFVYRQARLQKYRDAFLNMRIFKSRSYVLPTIVMTFVAMNAFGVVLVLPLVLTAVLGLTTLQMGLFLFPGGAMIALLSALGGRVYDKVGPKPWRSWARSSGRQPSGSSPPSTRTPTFCWSWASI
jgi:MFS transporter, DHA2 family, lincomycin resistance protein